MLEMEEYDYLCFLYPRSFLKMVTYINIDDICLHFPNQHGLFQIFPLSLYLKILSLIFLPFFFLENLYHFFYHFDDLFYSFLKFIHSSNIYWAPVMSESLFQLCRR